MSISENIIALNAQLAQLQPNAAKLSAAAKPPTAKRPATVRLPPAVVVAVAKTFPAEAVMAAADAGLTHFGENYLQEAEVKIPACADRELIWHFVGAAYMPAQGLGGLAAQHRAVSLDGRYRS